MSTDGLMDAVKARRSHYALDANAPVSDARVTELVKETLLHVPSAFNSQTTRAVILFKDEHKKFWATAKSTLAQGMDKETAEKSLGRLDGFAAAYGSILFFENQAAIKKMQDHTPAYAAMFPNWSEHTSGMHQLVLWTALETEGFGCNLQHYHAPQVEKATREIWQWDADWAMKAQLVFGGRADPKTPDAKPKTSSDETVKVYGA